jgi:hypothetical protein
MSARAVAVIRPAANIISRLAFLYILSGQGQLHASRDKSFESRTSPVRQPVAGRIFPREKLLISNRLNPYGHKLMLFSLGGRHSVSGGPEKPCEFDVY